MLLGLLFVPAVLAMYLLKLRRDEAVVPSTLLWTRLVADVEANAPWQRLRRSLLLLLQLLLVAVLGAGIVSVVPMLLFTRATRMLKAIARGFGWIGWSTATACMGRISPKAWTPGRPRPTARAA